MRQVVRYTCEECNTEHWSPDEAESCEVNCRESRIKRETRILEEKRWHGLGHDLWYENGMRHAPRVDPMEFGSHDYENFDGTSNCKHGCGCWMGSSRSGGPVNPFGACPANPVTNKPTQPKANET